MGLWQCLGGGLGHAGDPHTVLPDPGCCGPGERPAGKVVVTCRWCSGACRSSTHSASKPWTLWIWKRPAGKTAVTCLWQYLGGVLGHTGALHTVLPDPECCGPGERPAGKVVTGIWLMSLWNNVVVKETNQQQQKPDRHMELTAMKCLEGKDNHQILFSSVLFFFFSG